MTRAFGAVTLLVFGAFATSAQTKSKTWIRGTWEGTGYQIDDQSTWTMRLTAGGRRFSIDYSSLTCGGRWKLITIDAYRARFKEILNYGKDKCIDHGRGNSAAQQKSGSVSLFRCRQARSISLCHIEANPT